MTSTCGNSSAMSMALSHPNQESEIDAHSIRFDLLTKVPRRYPCRARGASPRQYRDPPTALSPRVPRKFYFRKQIGSSCEGARSAERQVPSIDDKSIVIRPQGENNKIRRRTLSSSSSAGIRYRWLRLLHRLPLTMRKNRSWSGHLRSTNCGGKHLMHIWRQEEGRLEWRRTRSGG